jgi:hypothetical protein
MQEEIFIASDKANAVTPGELAKVLINHGVLVRACAAESGWRLEFDDAPGTFAEISTDASGAARSVTFCIGQLRDVEDFRRIQAGFKQLGWQYCDSGFYDAT